MKTVLTTTAILNMLLVVLVFICVVIGAINKDFDLFAASVVLELLSIFPTAMMLVICTDSKEDDDGND